MLFQNSVNKIIEAKFLQGILLKEQDNHIKALSVHIQESTELAIPERTINPQNRSAAQMHHYFGSK
jgi:hypothetical protein